MKKIFTNLMKYFFVTKWVKSVSFLSFLILSGLISFAQTTYTWNQTGIASWAVGTNWTPTRIAPAVNDILVFDNAATTTPTNIPTETIGQLLISNNTVVNLQGAAAATVLTVSGLPGVDLSVSAGSALNINGAKYHYYHTEYNCNW